LGGGGTTRLILLKFFNFFISIFSFEVK
jgi:hypothetical protein